jgi:colicin import membrane protein
MTASLQSGGDREDNWSSALAPTERVAVLLVMEPGNRGIRRHNKTADPVLCGDGGCYVSNGTAAPASLLPTHRALGFLRTWGSRAGACNHALGCVFRDVDLTAMRGRLQPVDMRVLRHDRREAVGIDATSACKARQGHLTCRSGIHGTTYTMWIVPEVLANVAGPEALQAAVDHGLDETAQTEVSTLGWR